MKKKLHISRQIFTSSDPRIDGRFPVPLCGKRNDGIGTAKRGDLGNNDPGLIDPVRVFWDDYCEDCMEVLRKF